MHMADALLSPGVGATLWAGSVAVGGYASKRLEKGMDDRTIPMMGVLGAFVFAAQMVNFTIPGTGSSGHLAGGMILAILLGPHAAFLVMASVLTVQALFFADGGLLALGCNVWNLGFYPCYLVYPLAYRPIAGDGRSAGRVLTASILSAVVALQLGAFSVVLQTVLSGRSELPFGPFVLLMQPIHLAIGVVEGFVTAGIVGCVRNLRPEVLENAAARPVPVGVSLRKILAVFAVLALVTGGILSWFASTHPDGLEWAVERVAGESERPEQSHGAIAVLRRLQEKTAFLPDYGFRAAERGPGPEGAAPSWPGSDAATSLAGVTGAVIVFGLVGLIGLGIRAARRRG